MQISINKVFEFHSNIFFLIKQNTPKLQRYLISSLRKHRMTPDTDSQLHSTTDTHPKTNKFR